MTECAASGVLPAGPLRGEPERLAALCRSLRPPEYPADVFAIARTLGFKVMSVERTEGSGQLQIEGRKRRLLVPMFAKKPERHFTCAYLLGLHFLNAEPSCIRPSLEEREKEDAAAWSFAAELMMPEKLVEDALLGRVESIGQAAAALNVPPCEMERRVQWMYASEAMPWRQVRKHPEGLEVGLDKLLERNAAPVPIHFLALRLGARVRVMPQAQSGVLIFTGARKGSTAEISLSKRDPPTRQRFTLAMLLQVLLREAPGRYVRNAQAFIEPQLFQDYAELAGQLLVPPHLLRAMVTREYSTPKRQVRFQDVLALAKRFIVSRQAMEMALVREGFNPEKPQLLRTMPRVEETPLAYPADEYPADWWS